MKKTILLLIGILNINSCVQRGTIVVTTESKNLVIKNIQLLNHQFVISGANLNSITAVRIKESSTITPLAIDAKSNEQLIANTLTNVTFAAGKVFDFIISTASASTVYTINFSLCDSSLNGKEFNCSVVPFDKDVLSYDASTNKWTPRSIYGLTYKGTFSAAGGIIPMSGPYSNADFYIISAPGTIAGTPYVVGDWISYNGVAWQKIGISTAITSVFGRTGVVTANKGDYTFTKLSDVDLTTTPPIAGDILEFDGTNWVPTANTGGGGGAGTVTSVSGTAPINVATGTTTPVISITTASSGVAGALSATAFDTFNNKLTSTLTSGQMFVGNGSNVATGVAMSGDVTMTNAGVTAVGAGKITNSMLAGSIDITTKITGALPIANGGTAGNTAATARANLGLVIGSGAGELMVFTTSMSCFPYEKLQVSAAPYFMTCVTDNGNTNYAILAGVAAGQILNGGTAASENLTLVSTANATKGFVLINPTGGYVGIGVPTPTSTLNVAGSIVSNSVSSTVAYINFGAGNVQMTTTAATTINVCGMKTGGSYTLVLKGIAAVSTVTVVAYPTYVNTTSCSGTPMQVDLGFGAADFVTGGSTNILSFVYFSNIGANGTVYGIPATHYEF